MTTFEEIYDLFLISIQDYKLDKLYSNSEEDFKTFLQGFLIKAISNFDNCTKDIQSYDLTNQSFYVELDLKEKIILSNLMTIEWLLREIQNINNINLHLNDTDFKMYSEAQNLKEKKEYYSVLREIVNQDMSNYSLKNISWSDWAGGNYFA